MKIIIANRSHISYAQEICDLIETSAQARGTGIAKRSSSYIEEKIVTSNAIIALDRRKFVGFCYIESWDHQRYVANSGLIVHPDYRNKGVAKNIKTAVFQLSRKKFPQAKLFGITTGLAVMKINSSLGYRPVPFSQLTKDNRFWEGCQTCKNFDILNRTNREMCLCTGMVYDPKKTPSVPKKIKETTYKRLKSIKQSLFNKKPTTNDEN